MTPAHILVVDDHRLSRMLLASQLEKEGHRVVQAEDGRRALDMLRARALDLVLLDINMPEMSGIEVLEQRHAEPLLLDVPVIVISGEDKMASTIRCIELGAEDFLPKPFDPVLLHARIGACLEKKLLRDQEREYLATIEAQKDTLARQAAELREQAETLAEWNHTLEARVQVQVTEMERLSRLQRFFSPRLARVIIESGDESLLESHRREVTVVFCDLRGFTAFAETAEPEDVLGVLRQYLAALCPLIVKYEGTLERFAGDGMMIFFNDPIPRDDPAPRAVRMAVEMREAAAALAERWRRRGHDLDFGAGIAVGYATCGRIGFEGWFDYGTIGAVINLAARLCGEARPGQILVTRRVQLAVDGLAEAEPVGDLTLKGFARPVAAYHITSLRTAAAGAATGHEHGSPDASEPRSSATT
jgi:class 3 adenylate cyclase/ActR/RegA family two-component response regulator